MRELVATKKKSLPPSFTEATECRRKKLFSVNLGGFGIEGAMYKTRVEHAKTSLEIFDGGTAL